MTHHPPPPDPRTLDAPLAPGAEVGGYHIEALIGEGTCGRVYRARHPILGRLAAVKVLHRRWSIDTAMVARFVAEARSVNRIRHPAIVDVFGFGQLDGGRQYCVMEMLTGRTLEEHLTAEGALPLDAALPILTTVADALDAAHAAGVAHRDLKPANIFLEADGETLRPTLLDFGMSKLLDDGARPSLTRTGDAIGTPAYMAPEQCIGRAVDTRADLYAFGLVAWRLLAGRHPFQTDSTFEMMAAQIGEAVPHLSAVVRTIPRGVGDVLGEALSKAPELRPPSASVIVERIRTAPPTPARRAWASPAVLAAAAVLVATAWGVTALLGPAPDAPSTDRPTATPPSPVLDAPPPEAPLAIEPAPDLPIPPAPPPIAPRPVEAPTPPAPRDAQPADAHRPAAPHARPAPARPAPAAERPRGLHDLEPWE